MRETPNSPRNSVRRDNQAQAGHIHNVVDVTSVTPLSADCRQELPRVLCRRIAFSLLNLWKEATDAAQFVRCEDCEARCKIQHCPHPSPSHAPLLFVSFMHLFIYYVQAYTQCSLCARHCSRHVAFTHPAIQLLGGIHYHWAQFTDGETEAWREQETYWRRSSASFQTSGLGRAWRPRPPFCLGFNTCSSQSANPSSLTSTESDGWWLRLSSVRVSAFCF